MFVLLKVIITLQRSGRPILPELKFLFIELNLKYLFMSVTRSAKVHNYFALMSLFKNNFCCSDIKWKIDIYNITTKSSTYLNTCTSI